MADASLSAGTPVSAGAGEAGSGRAPLTVLVVDDGGYGMLRFDQRQAGSDPFGVDLTTPDWHQLAGAFGIECEEVQPGADLAPVLRRRLASGAPSLVVARTELPPPPSTSPRWYRRA